MTETGRSRRLLPARLHITDLIMGVIGIALVVVIIYGSIRSLMAGKYSATEWASFAIDGLVQGSVYSLIALGYTLVYGILRMINFAHGEVFMSGAFTTYFLARWMDRQGYLDSNPSFYVAIGEESIGIEVVQVLAIIGLILFSALISLAVAVILERVAYRPLRGAPRLIPLITAIGASFFLQYTFRQLYGSGVERYPSIDALKGDVALGGLDIARVDVVVILSSFAMMLGLYFYVQKTKAGMAMRAVSEDKRVAALMGIDVDRVITQTFVIGGALAGAAGVLYALIFGQVQFFMGFIPGLKAFTAAVLGGIGNIPGAMLGGLFLGLVESIGPFLFLEGLGVPSPNQLKDAIAFTMLVLVLIFRPTGILGERVTKRA